MYGKLISACRINLSPKLITTTIHLKLILQYLLEIKKLSFCSTVGRRISLKKGLFQKRCYTIPYPTRFPVRNGSSTELRTVNIQHSEENQRGKKKKKKKL